MTRRKRSSISEASCTFPRASVRPVPFWPTASSGTTSTSTKPSNPPSSTAGSATSPPPRPPTSPTTPNKNPTKSTPASATSFPLAREFRSAATFPIGSTTIPSTPIRSSSEEVSPARPRHSLSLKRESRRYCSKREVRSRHPPPLPMEIRECIERCTAANSSAKCKLRPWIDGKSWRNSPERSSCRRTGSCSTERIRERRWRDRSRAPGR
mmetsp:Transcript_30142/g.62735  ORF Transcript_30142/g.62735 Transcript_30142/m.62735 type:complete len:210 (+) Transcript_30142:329-958(+)